MKKILTKILSAMLIAACILSISACLFDMEAESISLVPLSAEEYQFETIDGEEIPVFSLGAPMPMIKVEVMFKGETEARTLSVWKEDRYLYINTYLGIRNMFDSSTPGIRTMTITSGDKSCDFKYKILD